MKISKPCLSVRTLRKEITLASSIHTSPPLVNDTSMERSSWVVQHGNIKIWIFFQRKFGIEFWLVFWLVPTSWNHLSFVNISHILVIDTSMERSSQVLTHGHPNFLISFHKVKVAKARKNLSVRRNFPRIYIYNYICMGSVAVHFIWLLSTMEATNISSYL